MVIKLLPELGTRMNKHSKNLKKEILESIMLNEISQAVRDIYHMISPLTGT